MDVIPSMVPCAPAKPARLRAVPAYIVWTRAAEGGPWQPTAMFAHAVMAEAEANSLRALNGTPVRISVSRLPAEAENAE